MNIQINTESIDFLKIDGVPSSFAELDSIINNIIVETGINLKEYTVSNKYLRAIVKKDDYEYHILEKAKGVNNIHYVGVDMKKHTVQFDMPYTIMLIKFKYVNGNYIKQADRIFHSNEPVKKDLSNSLWRWGLSNVYDSNYICWGKEKMPDIDKENSYQYIDEFFLGVKNNDLIRNKNLNWANINDSKLYTLNLDDLTKMNYQLKDVIGSINF